MATRSTIAMECEYGTIKQIYCHYYGYPAWNGLILKEYYKDKQKVDKILALGSIKSLWIDEKTTFALMRDGGLKEDEVPAGFFTSNNLTQKFINKDEYLKRCNFQGDDYFMDEYSTWWYRGWENDSKWEKLEDHISRFPDEDIKIFLKRIKNEIN